jgi:hypothetical protein
LPPERGGGNRERTLKVHHLAYLRNFVLMHKFEDLSVYNHQLCAVFPQSFRPPGPNISMISRALDGMGLSLQARRTVNENVTEADILVYAAHFPFDLY